MLRHSRSGFTLVELIVGMTIFSLAITAIFLLLDSTMKSVKISRSEIIVANLLREQIELVRNVRDSNIAKGGAWDIVRVDNDTKTLALIDATNNKAIGEGSYTIENNFQATNVEFSQETDPAHSGKIIKSPIEMKTITNIPKDIKDNFSQEKLKEKFEETQLCFDKQKRYFHCKNDSTVDKTASGTTFASYIYLEPMWYEENGSRTRIEIEIGRDAENNPIMKAQ